MHIFVYAHTICIYVYIYIYMHACVAFHRYQIFQTHTRISKGISEVFPTSNSRTRPGNPRGVECLGAAWQSLDRNDVVGESPRTTELSMGQSIHLDISK